MADVKISEMTSAVSVDETDNLELSQENSGVFTSVKASILAIANKIASGINFTSALETTNKTLTGAINEAAQSGGSGGHTILDDSGTSLAQEDSLQFVGVYSEDDSINEKTVVNIVREMTQAQYDLLSADEKKGIIRITDKNYVCEASEVKFGSGNVEAEVEKKMDWVSNGILGAKNRLPFPYYQMSGTVRSIPYAAQPNGGYYLNGTNDSSTNRAYIYMNSQSFADALVLGGKHIVSFSGTGTGLTDVLLRVTKNENGTRTSFSGDIAIGEEMELTFVDDGNTKYDFEFAVRPSGSVDCYVYPLVRVAEDTDNTYKPYAMTNKQLTDIVNNVPTTAGTYNLQAVRNADGTITYSWV